MSSSSSMFPSTNTSSTMPDTLSTLSTVVPDVGSLRYTRHDYWEKRFAEEETYEWLGGWKDPVIKDTIESLFQSIVPLPFTKEHIRILLLGTGNSPLPLDLAKDGYKHIYATDYSATVIQRMREGYGNTYPSITWAIQDMTNLTYNVNTSSSSLALHTMDSIVPSFDVVLDKAAMDALLAHGGDVWDPPRPLLQQTYKVCAEVHRVLYRVPSNTDKDTITTTHTSDGIPISSNLSTVPRLRNGLYIQLSFGQPHFRQKYLLQPVNPITPSSTVDPDQQSSSSSSYDSPTPTTVPSSVSPDHPTADEDDEWEPDKNPDIQPYVHTNIPQNLDHTFWKFYHVINIPVEFGYYLYVMERT